MKSTQKPVAHATETKAEPTAKTLASASIVAAPAQGRTIKMAGIVGETYGIAVTVPGGTENVTKVLPFLVSEMFGKAGSPVQIIVASVAPNWLGMNGRRLKACICHSPDGSVAVQRHQNGVQVNAYPEALRETALRVEELGAVTGSPPEAD